jgi:hypothetical protein
MTSLFISVLLLLQGVPAVAQAGTVSGVLKTPDGNAISAARVSVIPAAEATKSLGNTAIANIGVTDNEGRFTVGGIPPGLYYIAAGRIDSPTYYPGTQDLKSATLVPVTASVAISGIDFRLADVGVVRATTSLQTIEVPVQIRVEGGGKIPVSSGSKVAVIRIARPGTSGGSGSTLAAASKIRVTSGTEFEVRVDNLPEGYAVQSMTYGSTDLRKERLHLPPVYFSIADGKSVIIPHAPSPTITVVLTNSPKPVPPSGVRVTGQVTGNLFGTLHLSGTPGTLYSDGSFEFLGVKPGRHILAGLGTDRAFGAFVVVGDRDVTGVELRDVAGPLPSDLSQPRQPEAAGTLAPGSVLPLTSLNGIVLDEASRRPLGDGILKLTGYNKSQYLFVDEQGRFTFPRLFPGTYTIEIDNAGHEPVKREFTVGSENITLELSARRP